MIQVLASSVIPAPPEAVWAAIRNFDAVADWLPAAASARLEEGGAPDRVGSVRHVEMVEGGAIREKLLALSDVEHCIVFAIIESQLPIENYRSTVRLLPITDGDQTYISWSGEFDAPADKADDMAARMPAQIYQPAFDRLKKRFSESD